MKNRRLEKCSDPYPTVLKPLVNNMSREWADSEERPKLRKAIVEKWDELIDLWIADRSLPLFVRKSSAGRGKVITHSSSRILIPADNSPAHWSFMLAFQGQCPTTDEIRRMLKSDSIPFAMIYSRAERGAANYKGAASTTESPNKLGWKVCHKTPVGLKKRGSLDSWDIVELKEHFKNFISPSNMFLVPKKLAGLGEFKSLIQLMKDRF